MNVVRTAAFVAALGAASLAGIADALAAGASPFGTVLLGPLRLRRYWIEFDFDADGGSGGKRWHSRRWLESRLGRGCGVTARGEAECLRLVRDMVVGSPLPPVRRILRDVDPKQLSAFVQSTMDAPGRRGVWYPPSPAAGTRVLEHLQ